jgi:hypothetical protein
MGMRVTLFVSHRADFAPRPTQTSLRASRPNRSAASRFRPDRRAIRGYLDIVPAIVAREPIKLNFRHMDLCTQSWLHALLYESIRLAWARRVPIDIVNADPAVREGLRFLEAYALGG